MLIYSSDLGLYYLYFILCNQFLKYFKGIMYISKYCLCFSYIYKCILDSVLWYLTSISIWIWFMVGEVEKTKMFEGQMTALADFAHHTPSPWRHCKWNRIFKVYWSSLGIFWKQFIIPTLLSDFSKYLKHFIT